MNKGINIGSTMDKFIFYTARFYNRIREDRAKRRGTTPTTFKIPLSQMLFLPQIHPATDIPYSYVKTLIPDYIGRKLLLSHKSLNLMGYIAHACISENPEHCLEESDNEDCTYEGKPIKFHAMTGVVGVEKSKKKMVKDFHINKFTDLDCSVGYSYSIDVDEADLFLDDDGCIDYNKTLVYATGFEAKEISLCDRGKGACKGAGLLQELTKSSRFMSDKLRAIFLKTNKIVKTLSTNPSNKNMDKIEQFGKAMATFARISRGIGFKARCLEKFKELKNIKEILTVFKKKNMDKNKSSEDKMEIDTPLGEENNDGNTKKNEQKAETPVDPSGTKGNGLLQKKGQPKKKEFNQYLRNKMGLTDEASYQTFFEKFGEDCMFKIYNEQKEYTENSNKSFPGFQENFQSAVRITKNNNEFTFSEEDTTSLKNIYTDHDNENINKMFNSILKEFIKKTEKAHTLGNPSTKARPKIKYNKPRQGVDDRLYINKLTKEETSTRKETLTLGARDSQLEDREKIRNRLVKRGDIHKFAAIFNKHYKT